MAGLNTIGFIKSNSLTYTEIQNDLNRFIEALSEDEKLGFKTLFEGSSSQILIEMIAAKMSDEIYHIITSRSENLMYYLNRLDSAIAKAQNVSYPVFRGSNVKLRLTITPNTSVLLHPLDIVGTAEDFGLIVDKDIALKEGDTITFDAYLGNLNEQSLTVTSSDFAVFRFTNQNISEQIALYLNDEIMPTTSNILEMTDDKYFCITNAYTGVDVTYLNDRPDFIHKYANGDKLTLKYIEFANIAMDSVDVTCHYGDIEDIKQVNKTLDFETIESIRNKANLYAETQNRIVARDDFQKVFEVSNPEIANAVGHDFSNAQVEVTYVKYDGTLLTGLEYEAAYNNLYNRRAYGIPMCLLEHPDAMFNLELDVILQLVSGSTAVVAPYVRQVLENYELRLGETIDFTSIEYDLESFDFVKTARVYPKTTTFEPNALVPTGTTIAPTYENGKIYVVRNPLFLTGADQPSWDKTIGGLTEDNDIIWQCEERAYTQQPIWSAKTAKDKESIVWLAEDTTVQFRCIGFTYSTGGMEPAWPTKLGEHVSDGRILWTAIEKDATALTWLPNKHTSKGDVVNSTSNTSFSYQAINYVPRMPKVEPRWSSQGNTFIDGEVEYAILDENFDDLHPSNSLLTLKWNQYCKFKENIQVV